MSSQDFFTKFAGNWASSLDFVAAGYPAVWRRVCQNTSAAFRTAKRLHPKVEC